MNLIKPIYSFDECIKVITKYHEGYKAESLYQALPDADHIFQFNVYFRDITKIVSDQLKELTEQYENNKGN